jgi:hypothetical protein
MAIQNKKKVQNVLAVFVLLGAFLAFATAAYFIDDVYVSSLQSFIDSIVDNIGKITTALAAVGVLSMSLLQMLKSVHDLKKRYLAHEFEQIFHANFPGPDFQPLRLSSDSGLKTIRDHSEFSNKHSLFVGEIASIKQKLVRVFRMLLEGLDDSTISAVAGLAPKLSKTDFQTLLAKDIESQAYILARSRAIAMNQMYIDSMFLLLGEKWARSQQLYSTGISAAIIILSAIWTYVTASRAPSTVEIVMWLMIALLGGAIAPFAKDILNILRSLKSK